MNVIYGIYFLASATNYVKLAIQLRLPLLFIFPLSKAMLTLGLNSKCHSYPSESRVPTLQKIAAAFRHRLISKALKAFHTDIYPNEPLHTPAL